GSALCGRTERGRIIRVPVCPYRRVAGCALCADHFSATMGAGLVVTIRLMGGDSKLGSGHTLPVSEASRGERRERNLNIGCELGDALPLMRSRADAVAVAVDEVGDADTPFPAHRQREVLPVAIKNVAVDEHVGGGTRAGTIA